MCQREEGGDSDGTPSSDFFLEDTAHPGVTSRKLGQEQGGRHKDTHTHTNSRGREGHLLQKHTHLSMISSDYPKSLYTRGCSMTQSQIRGVSYRSVTCPHLRVKGTDGLSPDPGPWALAPLWSEQMRHRKGPRHLASSRGRPLRIEPLVEDRL